MKSSIHENEIELVYKKQMLELQDTFHLIKDKFKEDIQRMKQLKNHLYNRESIIDKESDEDNSSYEGFLNLFF